MKSEITVAVVAPSSPAKKDNYEAGIAELERRFAGVRLLCEPAVSNAGSESGFTCGSRQQRLNAIYQAMEDPDIDAVICLRGGTGASELLPLFDFRRLSRSPKPFVGFSDVTPLLLSLNAFAGIPTVHGPNAAVEFARAGVNEDARMSVDLLQGYLGGKLAELRLSGKSALELLPAESPLRYRAAVLEAATRTGAGITAPVVPANLTMLLSLIGTPWEPDLNGVILLVEEVNEAPYRIYRMLTQLLLAGKLDNLRALAFGGLSLAAEQPRDDGAPHDEETLMRRLMEDLFAGVDFPILYGMPIGHQFLNYPVPVRSSARIEGSCLIIDCHASAVVGQ